MRTGNRVRLFSLVAPPLLTTLLTGILNPAAASGRSGDKAQEAALNPITGAALPTKDSSQSSRPEYPQPAPPKKSQKPRKWTGNLVDAACMNKALNRLPSYDEALFPDPLAGIWQTLHNGEQAERERNPGAWSPQGQPQTPSKAAWSGDSDGEPEASERQLAMQRAQLKAAERLEQGVKACTPIPSTMHYGLVVSSGELLKFDSAGDSKARDAMNTSPVEPGETVKVKVTAVIEAEDTLRVAAIEIKGRVPALRLSSRR